jgi:hypothetical protein
MILCPRTLYEYEGRRCITTSTHSRNIIQLLRHKLKRRSYSEVSVACQLPVWFVALSRSGPCDSPAISHRDTYIFGRYYHDNDIRVHSYTSGKSNMRPCRHFIFVRSQRLSLVRRLFDCLTTQSSQLTYLLYNAPCPSSLVCSLTDSQGPDKTKH